MTVKSGEIGTRKLRATWLGTMACSHYKAGIFRWLLAIRLTQIKPLWHNDMRVPFKQSTWTINALAEGRQSFGETGNTVSIF